MKITILILSIFLLWSFDLMAKKCSSITINQIREYVEEECRKRGIDYKIVLAIAKTESSLNPCATNWKEKGGIPSRGLFQIRDTTARSVCNIKNPRSLYEYKLNTRCSLKLITILLKRYGGDYLKSILAYNAGDYYLCKDTHSAQQVDCIVGLPVNMEYLSKVYSNI